MKLGFTIVYFYSAAPSFAVRKNLNINLLRNFAQQNCGGPQGVKNIFFDILVDEDIIK